LEQELLALEQDWKELELNLPGLNNSLADPEPEQGRADLHHDLAATLGAQACGLLRAGASLAPCLWLRNALLKSMHQAVSLIVVSPA
jgi:hypothetical protein